MWYECIPSMAIITVCMSMGNVFAYGINKLFHGNAYNRNMNEGFDRWMYMRDRTLTGDAYKVNGLDSLDGEEQKKK